MKRLVAGMLAVAAVFGWGSAAPVDAAAATGCHLSTNTRSVSAYCSGGSGYYRAAAKIRWSSGAYQMIYGSWQRPGGFSESYRNAPSGSVIVVGYLQATYG